MDYPSRLTSSNLQPHRKTALSSFISTADSWWVLDVAAKFHSFHSFPWISANYLTPVNWRQCNIPTPLAHQRLSPQWMDIRSSILQAPPRSKGTRYPPRHTRRSPLGQPKHQQQNHHSRLQCRRISSPRNSRPSKSPSTPRPSRHLWNA